MSQEHYEVTYRKYLNKDHYGSTMGICTVDNRLSTCEIQDDQIVCPKISMCLVKLQSEELPVNIVNVLAGMYYDDDCENIVSTTGPSGMIIITSSGGTAIFNCQNTQFLSIAFLETTTLVIDDFAIIGGGNDVPQNYSKIEVTDLSYGQSNVYVQNVFATNCSSAKNGGFMSAININLVKTINSIFTNNEAQNSSAVIYAPDSVLEMTDSSFDNNYSNYYGGVAEGSFLNVYNSSFYKNEAYRVAGCFLIAYDTKIELSIFTLNWAVRGGILFSQNGETNISFSQFYQNSAVYGGVVYGTNITIASSYFEENRCNSQWSGYGAVAYALPADIDNGNITVEIKDSIFKNNIGFYGGGVVFLENANLVIDNCTFTNNTAELYGGALYLDNRIKGQTIVVTNSFFSHNFVEEDGGAIYLLQNYDLLSSLNLTGSIFENNTALDCGGGIFWSALTSPFIGGQFLNSNSSQTNSTTFYAKSLINVNLVNITKDLPEYNVPIFKEPDFIYWKAIGVQGNCNGVATINEDGVILSCNQI